MAESPVSAADVLAQGIRHHVVREFGAAVDCYSRVLAQCPDRGDAWRLLGVVALQSSDLVAARRLLERAIRIDSQDAAAYSALGSVAELDRQPEVAYDAYAAAVALDGMLTEAAVGFMRVALELSRPHAALAAGNGTVARGAVDASLMRLLGAARLAVRDYAAAADSLLKALQLDPHPDAYANLAAAYTHLQRFDAAIAAATDALTLAPRHAQAANNLGVAYKASGAFAAALSAFELAIALGSDAAHVSLGATHLLLGNYARGWNDYRWVTAERRANPAYHALPMWDGRPAPGQRLLVWPELGIGDTLLVLRFVTPARALVGSLTLGCLPATLDLARTVAGVDALVDTREPLRVEDYDLWIPATALPAIFGVTRDSIPVAPYLHADNTRIERFEAKLHAPGRLRVGLVWSGNPDFPWNDTRSCGLAALGALRDVPNVAWFALQQGPARAQAVPSGMRIVPINAEVSDFADTAAIISQLDLVVTVDTSVANLAGALGRPVWVLLSNRPDWRWSLAGDVSPWYPTSRLFRAGEDGAWEPVIARVAAALNALVACDAPS